VRHQDKPRTIKLRGEWIPMDPRHWNAEMDCKVSVGLGHGTKDQQAAMVGTILQLQEKIVQLQGGLNGPLVYASNAKYGLDKFVTGPAGFKDADKFFADPSKPPEGAGPAQPPRPDPKMLEVQGKLQLQQQESQAKLQMDGQKAQMDMQAAEAKAGQDMQLAQFMAELEARTKLRIAEMEAQTKIQIAQMTESIKAQMGAYTPQPTYGE